MAKNIQLGLSPKLPKKIVPGYKQFTDGTLDFAFVLDEKEKTEEDYSQIKRLVYHYEWIGRQQVTQKREAIAKKFNLAIGIIDHSDYISTESEHKQELEMLDNVGLDFDLKFYPIVPNIVNTLVNERFKHLIRFSAYAVNEEATNEVIEQKNNALREMLIAPLQAQFDAGLQAQGIEPGTDVYAQQQEIFRTTPKIQEYYSKEYRLEIEKWAAHQLEIDERRFKFKDLEKQALFNKVVSDYPFIHINYLENDYKPEVLDPRFCYYLRSPYLDDVSEGVMFGWFEYESPLNLITRFGDKLSEEDIEKLQSLHIHYRTLFTRESPARYNLDTPGILESAQNHLAFNETFKGGNPPYKDSKYRGDEYKERLVEVSNQYIQVPRKLGKLTMVSGQDRFSTIVDDTYKVTYKPTYDTSIDKEKTTFNLINGEHVEWFYINELWRCVKINLSVNPNPDNSDDIFLVLEKHPVQIPKKGQKYGSVIPVHGGPTSNKYNSVLSIVDRCKPWQVFYNYLWNRNDQLLKGEIGKFFAMNQNMIPQESMGESWGQHNVLKFALAARDTSIGVLDTSVSAMGGTNLLATGGYGQMVDLTVTDQVINKAKLAEMCKTECFFQLGLSPQILGDISPEETATGIAQGINRSITQIKGLYEEHFSLIENVKTTMLEYARFLAIANGYSQQTYINDEGERIIHQVPSDLLLHQLGVFVTSNMDDTIVIEQLRSIALNDNTLGADILDKFNLIASKSSADIHSKLKKASVKRERELQKDREAQEQQQLQILESQERQLQMKLQEESRQKDLDREHELRVQEMKVIGQSQFSEGGGYDELMKLRESQLKTQNYYQSLIDSSNKQSLQMQDKANAQQESSLNRQSKENLEREKIAVQREKILADLEKSRTDLQIAKVNK